ncbi:MAG: hypothetical protein DCC71_17265 [Proteobacteria bacterium]|nr:MAG: hypothetical protein DCC71_17265 [Pseudomonadota bacterium]
MATALSRVLGALAAAAIVAFAAAAPAFPPYRSTDAEVIPAGLVELRLGFVRLEREDGDSESSSPLLRVNLGIGHDLELVSELEHRPETGRLGDAAVGIKWASAPERVSVGVETLALLPVTSDHSGAGVESQLLATVRRDPFRLHANAGGFYDARPSESERGWRASLLGEWERGRARVGAELFARQVGGESVRVQAGPGVIVSVGAFDVRASFHAGLTADAPDLTATLWISTEWQLW